MTERKRRLKTLQPNIVRHLREYGPSTSRDIAEVVGVHSKSVVGAMRRLASRGIVVRSNSLRDQVAVWQLRGWSEDDEPQLKVTQLWLGVGSWDALKKVPRTSVFDTRGFPVIEEDKDG